MSRLITALGTVNPVLLIVTLAVIGGAGYHAWREWSDAATEAQAQHERDTEDDLAERAGLKQTSIGKRRGELRDAGLVRKLDDLGVSDTGSACIRWALTDAGMAAA